MEPEVITITTVPGLRCAIAEAFIVLIQPRFGTSETWLRITKAEARVLAQSVGNAAPDQVEMPSGHFGELRLGALYLG
jgi:hypothetical protein